MDRRSFIKMVTGLASGVVAAFTLGESTGFSHGEISPFLKKRLVARKAKASCPISGKDCKNCSLKGVDTQYSLSPKYALGTRLDTACGRTYHYVKIGRGLNGFHGGFLTNTKKIQT